MLPIDVQPEKHIRRDVSDRALAIARQIDQLPKGAYSIRVDKMTDDKDRWVVTIEGLVEVKSFRAYERNNDRPAQETD